VDYQKAERLLRERVAKAQSDLESDCARVRLNASWYLESVKRSRPDLLDERTGIPPMQKPRSDYVKDLMEAISNQDQ
jgi:hypothetical protein